ncbi:MAG: TolC family protein [Pseudomonadota bacterium]
MNRILPALLGLLVLGHAPGFAQEPLTLEELLDASADSVPVILEARSRVAQREAQLNASQGAFDRQFSTVSRSRAAGFYGLSFIDSRLAQPLRHLGGEVYAGYRISDGDFPVYEDEYVTLGAGEFNFGATLPLLRNREIDRRRMAVRDNVLNLEMAQLDQLLAGLSVQHDAMTAYWNWVAAGRQLVVFEDLQSLAMNRISALSTRVAEGDLADINLVENQQQFFARRAAVVSAQRVLDNAALALSLYFRDADGEPTVPARERLPENFPLPQDATGLEPLADLALALDRQVELALIDRRIELAANRQRLARNDLLPSVDLDLKVARDFGGGSPTRDETDLFVGINVSVPLERRRARGEQAAAEAEMRALSQRRRMMTDQLRAQISQLSNTIEAARTTARLAGGERALALQLEEAEQTRFREGASSFFLLNQREDATADARLKEVSALAQYHRAVTDYLATTADFEALRVAQ